MCPDGTRRSWRPFLLRINIGQQITRDRIRGWLSKGTLNHGQQIGGGKKLPRMNCTVDIANLIDHLQRIALNRH